jgi:hypothetical protein
MLDEMPTELLDEWIAFYRLEPFGEEWLQTSYLCSIVLNLAAKDSVDLDHFVPDFTEKKNTVVDDEAQMAAMYGVTK